MNQSGKPKLIAIVGPTASGKTALAIDLARRFGGEIVSADARQIYRGMDIGTAKPTATERATIPHHLIDIRDPDDDYTVADYQRDAFAAIDAIVARGAVPFLVGGTGLFVRAVVENLDIPGAPADPTLRAAIENEIARDGLAAAFARLVALDPDAAAVVDPKNPRRVVRALEVARATGKPFTAQRRVREPRYETLTLGLDLPPEILRSRIEMRVNAMIESGFAREVAALLERYGAAAPAFNAIGYREMAASLNGGPSLAETATLIVMDTWHYAKRQRTWFKKSKGILWIAGKDEAAAIIGDFLRQ